MGTETLTNLLIPGGFTDAYSEEYLHYIESLLEVIRPTAVPVPIQPTQVEMYTGCLYIMLTHMGHPKHLHYLIMRLMGLRQQSEFNSTHTSLMLPDEQYVANLNRLFITQNKRV